MLQFNASHLFPFPFRDVALGIWHKYPNEHARHIMSVDVLDRRLEPDGSLRTERLIRVRQDAPRWVLKLIGGDEDQFVREVVFFTPSPPLQPHSPPVPPTILMSSVNLSLASVLICHEKIRYQPAPVAYFSHTHTPGSSEHSIGTTGSAIFDGTKTLFRQVANMEAQGRLGRGSGSVWENLGRKIEKWSVDRFGSNAAQGREGFTSVLERLFGPRRPGPTGVRRKLGGI